MYRMYRMFRINLGPRSQDEVESIEAFMRGHKCHREHRRGTMYNTKWSIRVQRPSDACDDERNGDVLVSFHCGGQKRLATVEALARRTFGNATVRSLGQSAANNRIAFLDVYEYPLPSDQYIYASDDRDLAPLDEACTQLDKVHIKQLTLRLKYTRLRLKEALMCNIKLKEALMHAHKKNETGRENF